ELDFGFLDADYCLRARAAGFQVLCCGAVTLHDRELFPAAEDLDQRIRSFQRSRHAFRERWHATLGGRYRHEISCHSILESPTGYALACCEMHGAHDSHGGRVSARYVCYLATC